MNRFLLITFLICCFVQADAHIRFEGLSLPAISVTPTASSGLDVVYVLNSTDGVSAIYTPKNGAASVVISRYSALGGGFAEPVAVELMDSEVVIPQIESDMGYLIEDGSSRFYCWVVDYSRHELVLNSMTISPESDCSTVMLQIDGKGERITYYSINGAPLTLDRELRLMYYTLNGGDDNMYHQTEVSMTYDSFQSAIHAPAPLCDTDFLLTGDRFLREWNEEKSVLSSGYQAIAVAAITEATQESREIDNEKGSGDGGGLGGSAPAEVRFCAEVSDAAIFREWQFAYDADFNNIFTRYNDTEVSYTFREAGTTYVRFMAANASGVCEYYSSIYEISIGESALDCPNAFSPGVSEGVNDEWKVSYKSIIEFDCAIFNRWGQQIAHLTSPEQGWDGRYGGKLVGAGVYYYVIKARGADGKEYKLSGDINIVGFKRTTPTQNNGD